jgi:hypothetical protein
MRAASHCGSVAPIRGDAALQGCAAFRIALLAPLLGAAPVKALPIWRGTGSSNPSPSSKESVANLTRRSLQNSDTFATALFAAGEPTPLPKAPAVRILLPPPFQAEPCPLRRCATSVRSGDDRQVHERGMLEWIEHDEIRRIVVPTPALLRYRPYQDPGLASRRSRKHLPRSRPSRTSTGRLLPDRGRRTRRVAGSSSATYAGVGCRTRCWWSVTGRRV